MPSLFGKPWHWHRKAEAAEFVSATAADVGTQRVRISLNNTMISYTPALERSSARVTDSEPRSSDSEVASADRRNSSETEGSSSPDPSLNTDAAVLESPSSPDHSQLETQQEESERDQGEESEFDDDAVFALTPETCPGPLDDPLSGPERLPLRVFAGTWNMAARDPFAGRRGQYIGDAEAARELSEFLPLGYDLYVLGTQEKVSKHLHAAVLARLNVAGGSYQRLELSAPENRKAKPTGAFPSASLRTAPSPSNNDDEANRSLRASSFGLVGSPSGYNTDAHHESPSGSDNNRWSFVSALDWRATILQPHVAGLNNVEDQQHQRQDLPHASQHRHRRRRRPELPGQGGEVRGRGDGAFLSRKSTSLAVYVASHWTGSVRVVTAGAHKFSVTSGSKGGLAVSLQFVGDEQTLTFANCHLDANDACLRRQQLATLAHELPAAMGLAASDLASCSNHVVWMGDFNYQIRGLDADQVVELLRSNRHLKLHDRFDSLADDLAVVPALSRFREPAKWPSFYPTYKKLPDRRPQISGDPRDPDWPLKTYRIRYKEPFYKGGRVKARVPAWCDRILVSSDDAGDDNDRRLQVEQKACCGGGRDNMGTQHRDNYRAVNDSLRGSDHSPVSCTFVWHVRHPHALLP